MKQFGKLVLVATANLTTHNLKATNLEAWLSFQTSYKSQLNI